MLRAILLAACVMSPAPGELRAGAIAKSLSPAGTLSAKPASEDYFRVLPAEAEIQSGDMVATLPGAFLLATNGSIKLRDIADYDDRADVPILESAFILNEPKDCEFDLTLDRGRVDLTNVKASGKATVIARLPGEVLTLVLDTPGTRVALELCGRWPAGTRLTKGKMTSSPVLVASILVLQGAADIKLGGQTIALTAKQRILWDSVSGPRHPETLPTLPTWATEPSPNASALEAFREIRATQPAEAIRKFLASDDRIRQRIAIVTLGANDDSARLVQFLGEARTREEWDFGTTVLRHWLGRGSGQDHKLYEELQANGYTEPQARIVLQLLFGFSAEDLKQPETYEVLIDYLLHEKPAIRGLAAWHLARLVPKEKVIPYKLHATPGDCEQMHQDWKKLIPSGQRPSQ